MSSQPAPLRVIVHGVSGRMGQEVLRALARTPDLLPVGGVHRRASADTLPLPEGRGVILLAPTLEALLGRVHAHVVVDFTTAEACLQAARVALGRGLHFVTGTTGLTQDHLGEMDRLARQHGVGVIVAPNFAVGAVLLIHLSRLVGRYFDYADVIEAHHEAKIDAPSGTALAIARALAEGRGSPFTRPTPEKEPLPGSRGADLHGVGIHALRMQGRLAHHEVILGTAGQTLSLRHDTISRECYIPGVLLALRRVHAYKGLVYGLDKVMGLP
ncbi:MAG: 4-hydroxy-tetrahydrodipicolinate reductase [Dehalococcoidia bacterium]|nr:4-hydroxy-tetrahydrodipicolinate reductase [Dehalococcoidia bacterium]MDW8119188.1 4-hydroxy-tetrahydrodipicolinate reductase [Chloroflexota bacterium]